MLKNTNRTLTIQNVSLEEYLKKAIEDKDFLEEEIEKLKEKLKRYELKVPKANITKLEQELKLCDTYTKRKIIEYLELDTFELVKNISGTVNNANSSDVINFMDWWIARNTALKNVLERSIDNKKEFLDRMTAETKIKK